MSAGAAIASELAATGTRVVGFDPERRPPQGVEDAGSPADAAAAAETVLALTSAGVAEAVAGALSYDLDGLRARVEGHTSDT